jgi:putative acetyltransferase
MGIVVRGERMGDEGAIDAVNCRAFSCADEGQIVSDMRVFSPTYDRRFSVCAWDGDEMVGHALFNPVRMRLMGETLSALSVGPVAVVPSHQRQGVGGHLLRYGHELGRQEGFALAFLAGHSDYYPRHGYRACFGWAHIKIDVEKLPEPEVELEAWPLQPADLPWLVERLNVELADVDFALLRGTDLSEWVQTGINALVWRTGDGRRAAYAMSVARGRDQINMLLGDDVELVRQVLYRRRPERLGHHPSGWLAQRVLDAAWSEAVCEPSKSAMACELSEGVLAVYEQAVASGRPVGTPNWPLPFLAH